MTSPSVELHVMIGDRLVADADVQAIVAGRIYDHMPASGKFPCITFGPSDYVPDDAECVIGRVETIQLDCWSQDNGRLNPCKTLADAVKKALHEFDGELTDHALVELTVTGVRVFSDADRETAHGVVTVEAMIEEG